MLPHLLSDTPSALIGLSLSAILIFAALLVLTRVMGLRSFSKMSSMDFATTVALGAILATTILSDDTSVVAGALAFALLYGLQFAASRLRMISPRVEHLLESQPLLLVAHGAPIPAHLDAVRMTSADLHAKLRAGGVRRLSDVFAATLETSGDVSVLLVGEPVDACLFENVKGCDALHFGE